MSIKVAFIPPLGWERYFTDSTGIQMALAIEDCMVSPAYVNALKLASVSGDLVIVDNGEAEGVRARGRTVVDFANVLHAKELVLPDVMGNRHDTIARVTTFFNASGNYNPGMQYMAVAQGSDLKEAQLAIHYFANLKINTLEFGERIAVTTIGIPRNLGHLTGNPSARIDLANWITDEFPNRFQIHFLGAYFKWPEEVKYAAKYAPAVRSIDTSMPFTFAHEGRLLEMHKEDRNLEPPTRHPDYLKGTLAGRETSARTIARNIEVYKTWATGR